MLYFNLHFPFPSFFFWIVIVFFLTFLTFLGDSVFSFFFLGRNRFFPFFLGRFLGRDRVFFLFSWLLSFFLFSLVAFLLESVCSFFFTFLLSFINSNFSTNYCIFFQILKCILDSVCPHIPSVCHMASRVQKNHNNLRKKTIFNAHPVSVQTIRR